MMKGMNGVTPWKIQMEPYNGGLEDDFPFKLGDVRGWADGICLSYVPGSINSLSSGW